jgi:mannose-1-phosphate guanylyltransferase
MKALNGEVSGVSVPGKEIAPGIQAGLNVRIRPEACELKPPIYIGGSATVEDGARIVGPTWIGAGAHVAGGAQIFRSLVFDHTRIHSGATVRDTMICGSYSVRSDGTVLDLERSDIDFLVRDARDTTAALTEDQRQLLDLLDEFHKGISPDAPSGSTET